MISVINVKVDDVVKKKAQVVAKELGLNLSGVVNAYLRQFIRSGSLFVSSRFEEPSAFLREAICEAEDDKKRKKQYSFSNAKDALGFIDSIIAEKKK